MKINLPGTTLVLALAGTALSSSAQASNLPAPKVPTVQSMIASVDGEYLSYSGDYGSRRVVNGQTKVDFGKTKLAVEIAQGIRKAGGDKFEAKRLAASLVQEWTPRFSTRTSLGISGNQPVFVNRELGQEFSYKPFTQTVVTVGGRYARYFGDVEALSWSVGAAQYFDNASVSYRFSSYDVEHLGKTSGHLVGAKLDDRYGSNQLWLAHGTSLHDADWLATPEKGKFNSAELRRVQPIAGNVSAMVAVKRIGYDTGGNKYHGTGFRVGLVFGKK